MGLQWEEKLETQGEPLHYLREIYAPSRLRQLCLLFTQRKKPTEAWDLNKSTRAKLHTGVIKGALLDLKLIPFGPAIQFPFHTLVPPAPPRGTTNADGAHTEPRQNPWTFIQGKPTLVDHAPAASLSQGLPGIRRDTREQLTLAPGMSGILVVEHLKEDSPMERKKERLRLDLPPFHFPRGSEVLQDCQERSTETTRSLQCRADL